MEEKDSYGHIPKIQSQDCIEQNGSFASWSQKIWKMMKVLSEWTDLENLETKMSKKFRT